MEEAYKAGKIRAIGVSNFMPDRFVDLCGFVDIAPMVNQLEVHVFQQQRAIRPYLEKHGSQLMAWSPLAQGKNDLFHPPHTDRDRRQGTARRRPRWICGFSSSPAWWVIPKSTRRERMEENFALFDFHLTGRGDGAAPGPGSGPQPVH